MFGMWGRMGRNDVRVISTFIDIECSYTLRYYLRVVYSNIYGFIYTIYSIQCIYNSNN